MLLILAALCAVAILAASAVQILVAPIGGAGPARAASWTRVQNPATRGESEPHGRAVRRRGPRRRTGRVRRRALRRGGRAAHRAWSRSSASAAPACTGAASRPRSCSRRPRCCAPSAARRSSASTPASPTLDLAREPGPQAAGRRPAHQGPRVAAEGPQGHGRSPGTGTVVDAPARTRARRPTAPRSTGDALDPRDRLAAARSLPGPRLRRRRASCRPTTCSSSSEVPARVAIIGGGAIGCEFASLLADVGSRGDAARGAAADPPRRRRRRSPDASARAFKKRGITVHTGVRGHEHRGHARARRSRFEGRRAATQPVDGRQGDREHRARAAHRGRSGSKQLGVAARRARLRRASTATCARACPACTRSATSSPTPQLAHVGVRRGDRRDQDDPRRGRRRRSTTTRCRGASTATPRSRSAGSPRSRRSERGHDVVTSVHRFVRQQPGADHRRARRAGEDRRRARRPAPRRAHRRAVGDRAASPRATSR